MKVDEYKIGDIVYASRIYPKSSNELKILKGIITSVAFNPKKRVIEYVVKYGEDWGVYEKEEIYKSMNKLIEIIKVHFSMLDMEGRNWEELV